MADLVSSLTQPPDRSYVSYLRRNSDEFYWNVVTSQFAALNLGTADLVTKTPFRLAYVENVNVDGSYSWTLDVGNFVDGSYTYVSREIIGDNEYPDEQIRTVIISNGIVSGSEMSAELAYSVNRSIFSFLKRNSDDKYYDTTLTEFSIFNINTAPEAERDDFRITFAEDPAGTYKWTLDASEFPDGTYTIATRELSAGLESIVASDYSTTIAGGAVVEGAILGEVAISHDTGGVDNLTYQTAGGAPIEGAVVRVYRREDWLAENYSDVQGTSYTDGDGKWQTPVFVDTGRTYTIVMSKPGYYGPDSSEVVV